MKKSIKVLLIGLLISILNLKIADAATLKISGDTTLDSNKETKIEVKLETNAGEEVEKIEYTLSVNNITDASYKVLHTPTIAGEAKIGKNIITSTDVIKAGDITFITVKNISSKTNKVEAVLSLEDIKFTFKDKSIQEQNKISHIIKLGEKKAESKIAALNTLSVSDGTMSPLFKSDVYEYKVTNIKDTIRSITLKKECDNCSVAVTCELGCLNTNNDYRKELAIGKNIIKVRSTSEDGSNYVEYFLTVYRGETTDNSAFLSNIDFDGFKLNEKFDKEVLEYTLNIPYDLVKLNITYQLEDENAKVEIKGNDDLQVGENLVTITIVSAEGDVKVVYSIIVTKLESGEVITTTEVLEAPAKKSKTLLIVLLSLLGLAIVSVSAYFIFFKKKKVKEEEIVTSKEDELDITQELEKVSIDDALKDIMSTKELIINEEEDSQ